MRPSLPRPRAAGHDRGRGAPAGAGPAFGARRVLHTLLAVAALVAAIGFGFSRLVGWGTPVPRPVIPPPPPAATPSPG